MKEIQYLGIKETGEIDKRYNSIHTASFSIFECPICLKQYELKTSRGKKQKTCIDCRGTQNVTHGHSSKKHYYVWQSMKDRCNNPNNPKYHIYGGKGVTVDTKWLDFEGFWEDMGNGYKEGLTIDRINSSLGYNKENCRWISHSQNSSETTKRIPVLQYRMVYSPEKTWILEKSWESAQRAADELKLVPSHISAVCMGKRKTHGGFKWQYQKEI